MPECKREVIGKEIRPGIFFPPFFLSILGTQKVRVGERRKGAFSTQMTVKRNVGEKYAAATEGLGLLESRPHRP